MKLLTVIALVMTTFNIASAQGLVYRFNQRLQGEYVQKTEHTNAEQILIMAVEGAAAAGMIMLTEHESKEVRTLTRNIERVESQRTKSQIQAEIDSIRLSEASYDITTTSSRGVIVHTNNNLKYEANEAIQELDLEIRKVSTLNLDRKTREELISGIEEKIEIIRNNPGNWAPVNPRVVGALKHTEKKLSSRALRKIQTLSRQLANAPTDAEKRAQLSSLREQLNQVKGTVVRRAGNQMVRFLAKAGGAFVLADFGVRGYALLALELDPGLPPALPVAAVLACATYQCQERLNHAIRLFEEK